VFHEEVSIGYKSDNGSWSGIFAQVIKGIAEVGVGDFIVSKERSEVVAFTDTQGLLR
jgi:hypothetical protein